MSLPYYKRFPRDFLDGTIGLSLETKGAYAIVLDLIYMRDGRLADDARYIAGQLGCSVRKWTTIRAELIARAKLVCDLGFISNFRADYLLEDTRKYQDKQAENRGRPNKNSDLGTPPSDQSQPQSDTHSEEDMAAAGASAGVVVHLAGSEHDDWPEGDSRRHAEMLADTAGTIRLDLARQQGLATTMGRLHAWRRDGASWEHDVLPTVVSLAQKTGRPIASWKFFDAAIAQSIADNRQALTIPEAQTHESQTHVRGRRSERLDRDLANYGRAGAGADRAAEVMAARRGL